MERKITIKLILSIIFLGCLLDMPYGYFQFVRFVGMVGFILLAYYDEQRDDKTLMIVWICSAILINPFFRIPLGRTMWNLVDVIWVIILLTTLIVEYRARRANNN